MGRSFILADYVDPEYVAFDVSNVDSYMTTHETLDFTGWPVNLPFPKTFLEFVHDENDPALDGVRMGYKCEQPVPGGPLTVEAFNREMRRDGVVRGAMGFLGLTIIPDDKGRFVVSGAETTQRNALLREDSFSEVMRRHPGEDGLVALAQSDEAFFELKDIDPPDEWGRKFEDHATRLVLWTIALCNASNSVTEWEPIVDVSAPEGVNRKRKKKGKRPYRTYKVLNLGGLPKPSTRYYSEAVERVATDVRLRHHLVRCHIRTHTADPERPNKFVGISFVRAHTRGSKKNGVSEKDYVVKAPEETAA